MVKVERLPSGPGTHHNSRIHPQVDLGQGGGLSALTDSTRTGMRKAGYCVAGVYPSNGIFRGTGTIVTMAQEPLDRRRYAGRPAMSAAFETGGWGNNGPGSLMGSIALMRQTLQMQERP